MALSLHVSGVFVQECALIRFPRGRLGVAVHVCCPHGRNGSRHGVWYACGNSVLRPNRNGCGRSGRFCSGSSCPCASRWPGSLRDGGIACISPGCVEPCPKVSIFLEIRISRTAAFPFRIPPVHKTARNVQGWRAERSSVNKMRGNVQRCPSRSPPVHKIARNVQGGRAERSSVHKTRENVQGCPSRSPPVHKTVRNVQFFSCGGNLNV